MKIALINIYLIHGVVMYKLMLAHMDYWITYCGRV